MPGKVFLLPTYLDIENIENIPDQTKRKSVELKYIIVENIRTTRRYLKQIDRSVDIDSITFFEWDKHNKHLKQDVANFLKHAVNGNDIGILSEAGCPGVADPGQEIVAIAHQLNIKVVPMVGPNSILLALMASGMNGQQFRFHGYLPIDDMKKKKYIQYLEKEAIQRKETQIFMETPFRNNKILQSLLKTLQPITRLCIAVNISSANELIRTKTVENWKKEVIDLHKQPAIFLIYHP